MVRATNRVNLLPFSCCQALPHTDYFSLPTFFLIESWVHDTISLRNKLCACRCSCQLPLVISLTQFDSQQRNVIGLMGLHRARCYPIARGFIYQGISTIFGKSRNRAGRGTSCEKRNFLTFL